MKRKLFIIAVAASCAFLALLPGACVKPADVEDFLEVKIKEPEKPKTEPAGEIKDQLPELIWIAGGASQQLREGDIKTLTSGSTGTINVTNDDKYTDVEWQVNTAPLPATYPPENYGKDYLTVDTTVSPFDTPGPHNILIMRKVGATSYSISFSIKVE